MKLSRDRKAANYLNSVNPKKFQWVRRGNTLILVEDVDLNCHWNDNNEGLIYGKIIFKDKEAFKVIEEIPICSCEVEGCKGLVYTRGLCDICCKDYISRDE